MDAVYVGLGIGAATFLWSLGVSMRVWISSRARMRELDQKHKHTLEVAQWQETERNAFLDRVLEPTVNASVAHHVIDHATKRDGIRVRVMDVRAAEEPVDASDEPETKRRRGRKRGEP